MSAVYGGVAGDGLAGETARASTAYDMTSVFGLEVLILNALGSTIFTQPMTCDLTHSVID